MTKLDVGLVAGIIDARGHVSHEGRRGVLTPRVRVTTRRSDLMQWLAGRAGVAVGNGTITLESLMSARRVEVVNGVRVGDRPVCDETDHEFAAHHGYCLLCGLDGWTAGQRRETERLQRVVGYRTTARSL